MAITVWYIEGEDDVEEVEYKVWIVEWDRHRSQIAVEDDDERWEVEVDFYDDDWAWGHDQDRHASFRVRSQGLRDLLESEPSKRVSTKRRLRVIHFPPREFRTDTQLAQKAKWAQSDVGKKSHAKSNAKWAESDGGKKSNAKWSQSDGGKKTIAKKQAKWAQSDGGKKSQRKWKQSDEGKKTIAKRRQSDECKKSIAKSSLKWRQSDEGKKSEAKSSLKWRQSDKQRKHIERQELIVQQTASLRASSPGTADDRLCVARGDVLAATLAADGGSRARAAGLPFASGSTRA